MTTRASVVGNEVLSRPLPHASAANIHWQADEIRFPKLLFRQVGEVLMLYSPSPTTETNRPLSERSKDVANISVVPISLIERGRRQLSVNEVDGDEPWR